MEPDHEPPASYHVGVLLPALSIETSEERAGSQEEEAANGHEEASGWWGRKISEEGPHTAVLGHDVLRAAAEAVGEQVGLVAAGVVSKIEQADGEDSQGSRFEIGCVELTFGVTVTMGTGKAIEAFFSANGEATVEVKLVMKSRKG